MAKKMIEVKISPDGSEVQAEAIGVKGKACMDFQKGIQKALSGELKESKKKPEFYQSSGYGVSVGT